MHFDAFDSYVPGRSRVHRLDPRVKLLSCLLYILSVVLMPDGAWSGLGAAWLIVLGTGALAGMDLRLLLKRSLVALPFALAALTLPFTLPGEPIASWQIGGTVISISDAGLLRFGGIVVRSWLAVQAAVLLTATTHFPDLIHGLRHLRVPDLITGILSFMYRYVFVLADEALRLLRGRAARSAVGPAGTSGPGPPIRWRARAAGGMVGQLFLRSLDRSDRVHYAMQSRGYTGDLLTMNPHHMTRADWLALALAGALALVPHLLV